MNPNTVTHMTAFGPVEVRVDPKLDPWDFRLFVDATRVDDHGGLGGIVRTFPPEVRPFIPVEPSPEQARQNVLAAIKERVLFGRQ